MGDTMRVGTIMYIKTKVGELPINVRRSVLWGTYLIVKIDRFTYASAWNLYYLYKRLEYLGYLDYQVD